MKKKQKKNKTMPLFRNASIAMSLLSWFTTYDGFKNTVFASNGHSGLTAALSSMAIQIVLLGGVLHLCPTILSIYERYKNKKQVQGKWVIRLPYTDEPENTANEILSKIEQRIEKLSNKYIKGFFKGIMAAVNNIMLMGRQVLEKLPFRTKTVVNAAILIIVFLFLLKQKNPLKQGIIIIIVYLVWKFWLFIYHMLMIASVLLLFIFALVTSVTFSYISIVNNMYQTDFAVNANMELDEFIKSTIQEMETDNQEYVDAIRTKLIKQLKKNGKKIIKKSAQSRAEDYAHTTAKLLKLVETKELIQLNKLFGEINKDKELLKNDKNEVKYVYRSIQLAYTQLQYADFIAANGLGDKQFAADLKNKTNNLNRDKYAIYSEYHHQYLRAVKVYNDWISNLRDGEAVPSLEKMQSLQDYCATIQSGLKNLKEAINGMKNSFAKKHTRRLLSEAKMNMDSLELEAANVQDKVESLINNSYGKDSLSFEQLIAAFGSSATSIEDLNDARTQLLEIQGTILSKKKTGDEKTKDITILIHNIENYIDAVTYVNALQSMKQKANTNYNIVTEQEKMENNQEEIEIEDTETDMDTETEIQNATTAAVVDVDDSVITCGSVSIDLSGSTKASIKIKVATSKESESVDENNKNELEEEKEHMDVIDVTSDEWTGIKKSQMTELVGLIYSHPANLYCSAVTRGSIETYLNMDEPEKIKKEAILFKVKTSWDLKNAGNKESMVSHMFNKIPFNKTKKTIVSKDQEKLLIDHEEIYWIIYANYREKAEHYRKAYLDTSESEKAFNLFLGEDSLFPYKGKAVMSFVFAAFLDGGAFMIGLLIFFAQKKKIMYRVKKEKKWLYINKKFLKR